MMVSCVVVVGKINVEVVCIVKKERENDLDVWVG